jgi:hypothetical protein
LKSPARSARPTTFSPSTSIHYKKIRHVTPRIIRATAGRITEPPSGNAHIKLLVVAMAVQCVLKIRSVDSYPLTADIDLLLVDPELSSAQDSELETTF